MKIRAFITHKLAESYADCQDAFTIDRDTKSVAVSDGMSQSIFPHYWAQLLTDTFVHDKSCCCTDEQIATLQGKWQEYVNDYLEKEKASGNKPWMLENCMVSRHGAGATFCGIRLHNGHLEGLVLGDTSLLILSPDNKVEDFCKTPNDKFDNHPDFYDSFNKGKGTPLPINKRLNVGEKLLIVSDPIGELLYKRKIENKESEIIELLLKVMTHDEFCQLTEFLREREGMHNDDTTLVIIENDGEEKFIIEHQDNINELISNECSKEKSSEEQEISFHLEIGNSKNDNSMYESTFEDYRKRIMELFKKVLRRGGNKKYQRNLQEKRMYDEKHIYAELNSIFNQLRETVKL